MLADPVALTGTQRRALLALGALLGLAMVVAAWSGAEPFDPDSLGPGQDARAYWEASRADAPYLQPVGAQSAYLYSPAFLQPIAPLTAMSWTAFLASWTGLLLAATLAMAGPLLLGPVLLLTFFEIWGGNITLLLAVAIVAGFRWPAAWSFVLLTKVTPGIGLLWFAVRREWRSLGVALGVTLAIAGTSWAIAPELWQQWLALLLGSLDQSAPPGGVQLPLWIRLPIAGGLVVYAARHDRRWLVPVTAMLALPVLWWGGLSMLAAVVALRRADVERTLARALIGPAQPAVAARRILRRQSQVHG